MKTTPSFISAARLWLGAWLALVLVASASAQSAPTGSIEGRVFDTRRAQYLEMARVTVEGSQQETFTDAANTASLVCQRAR